MSNTTVIEKQKENDAEYEASLQEALQHMQKMIAEFLSNEKQTLKNAKLDSSVVVQQLASSLLEKKTLETILKDVEDSSKKANIMSSEKILLRLKDLFIACGGKESEQEPDSSTKQNGENPMKKNDSTSPPLEKSKRNISQSQDFFFSRKSSNGIIKSIYKSSGGGEIRHIDPSLCNKIYVKTGPMSSKKSSDIIITYDEQTIINHISCLIIKPSIDTRSDQFHIKSFNKNERPCLTCPTLNFEPEVLVSKFLLYKNL